MTKKNITFEILNDLENKIKNELNQKDYMYVGTESIMLNYKCGYTTARTVINLLYNKLINSNEFEVHKLGRYAILRIEKKKKPEEKSEYLKREIRPIFPIHKI